MASKEELHDLIERLPADEVPTALRFLEYLCDKDDPVLQALRQASEDDEPESVEEQKGAEEAWNEYRRGEARPWREVRKGLTGE